MGSVQAAEQLLNEMVYAIVRFRSTAEVLIFAAATAVVFLLASHGAPPGYAGGPDGVVALPVQPKMRVPRISIHLDLHVGPRAILRKERIHCFQ